MRRVVDYIAEIEHCEEVPGLQVCYGHEGSFQGYTLAVGRHSVKVAAKTALGAAYGINCAAAACKARAIEWLGEQRPRYERRIFFLEGAVAVSLPGGFKLSLPRSLTSSATLKEFEEALVALCRGVILLGFNTLAFGAMFACPTEEVALPAEALSLIDAVIGEFALELIAMPIGECTSCSLEGLLAVWPSCRSILYHAKSVPMGFQATRLDSLVAEAYAATRVLPGNMDLLFYVPYNALDNSEGLCRGLWSLLCDELPPSTTLIFGATAADPPRCGAAIHPFFDELCRSADVSSTPLMPIINAGCIGAGAGLWPLSLAPYIEQVVAKCRRHNFSGVIALSSAMPQTVGLSHSNLWVLGQCLWTPAIPACELMAMWFECFRADIDYTKAAPLLAEATALALDVIRCLNDPWPKNREQWRCYLESMLARLKVLALAPWDDCQLSTTSLPGLRAYFQPFYADMRRLLFHLILTHQVSLSQAVEEQDLSPGFWTSLKAMPRQGIRTGAEVSLLTSPKSTSLPDELQAIYSHNQCRWT